MSPKVPLPTVAAVLRRSECTASRAARHPRPLLYFLSTCIHHAPPPVAKQPKPPKPRHAQPQDLSHPKLRPAIPQKQAVSDKLLALRACFGVRDASTTDFWQRFLEITFDRDLRRQLTPADYAKLLKRVRRDVRPDRSQRIDKVFWSAKSMGIPLDNFAWMCRAESLAYARDYEEARKIFGQLRRANARELDAHAFAVCIRCEAAGGHVDAAEEIATEMKQALIRPNRAACAALVQVYIVARRDAEVSGLLDRLAEDGAELDGETLALLVGVALRRKSLVATEIILRRMASVGCLPNDSWHEAALRVMEAVAGIDMLARCVRCAGISWSSRLYSAFAHAYTKVNAPAKAEELFAELSLSEKLESAPGACKAMLQALCRSEGSDCGGVERAVQMIDRMGVSLDRDCCEALIWFYGTTKNVNKAEDVITLLGGSGKLAHHLLTRLYARVGDFKKVARQRDEYAATHGSMDSEMVLAIVQNWPAPPSDTGAVGTENGVESLLETSADALNCDASVTAMVIEWIQGHEPRDKHAYKLLNSALHKAVNAGELGRAIWINSFFQHLCAAPTPGLFDKLFELCVSASHPKLDEVVRSYFQWGDSLLAWIRIDNACRAYNIKLSGITTSLYDRRLRKAVAHANFVDQISKIMTGDPPVELRDDTRGRILLIIVRQDPAVGAEYLARVGAAALGREEDTRSAQLEIARDAPLAVAIALFNAFRNVGAPPFQSAAAMFLRRLVDAGKLDDARRFFSHMRAAGDAGITKQVPVASYNIMLKLAADAKDPQAFNNLYSLMKKAGHASNRQSRHSIIQLHVSRGEMEAALNKLISFGSKGAALPIATWGMVVAGFLQADDEPGAKKTLKMMRTAGQQPNVVVYTSLLKYYATVGKDDKVAEIEARMLADGVTPNSHTYSVLIDHAGKKGDAARARAIYDKMIASDVRPGEHAITGVMKACLHANDVAGVLAAHAEFRRWGVPQDRNALDALVCFRARMGDSHGAEAAMHALPAIDSTRYALWMGYAQADDDDDATTRAGAAFADWVDKLQDKSRVDIFAYNRLLDCYARAGDARAAVEHFRVLLAAGLQPDLRTYTAVIRAHAVAGDAEGVGKWWQAARVAPGIQLDEVPVTSAVNGLTKMNQADAAAAIIEDAQQMGIALGERAFCPMLEMAFERKDVDAAAAVLTKMRAAGIEPTVRSWSAVIAGLSRCGRYDEAWKLWLAVCGHRVAPPKQSALSTDNSPWTVRAPATREQLGQVAGHLRAILLDHCGYAGRPDRARGLWATFARNDWGSPVEENHLASLIECFCRNGKLDEAVKLYSLQAAGEGLVDVKPGVKTIGTLLSFLAHAGKLDEAKIVVHNMERDCPWVAGLLVKEFKGLDLELRTKGIVFPAD
ncbi:hypothetical protein HDU87_008417 [Geranomyces variabilis]|uniref:PROP1-like PPR domain-containing protein n=1 Tax=Geranomyces variabilis TaxID=109894 RepID=A0AAD5XJ19_9FUNG|nr:hypothetical protein HDU87_008417 [Geranomyces variabilis]